jgi:hypothetical protein
MNSVLRFISLTVLTALTICSTASAEYFVEKWVTNSWVPVATVGYDIVDSPGSPPTIRFRQADFFGQFRIYSQNVSGFPDSLGVIDLSQVPRLSGL